MLPKNIAMGWLNELDNSNPHAISFSQNLTDLVAMEYSFYNDFTGYYGTSIDDILQQVYTKHDYVIILAVGNKLLDTFILSLAAELKTFSNTAFVGHILDKKDRYYKLYPQALLVNLKWYREYNCPKFGNKEDVVWSTTNPIRSIDNFHDDYTPLWVKQGTEVQQYTGRECGWNFMKVALDSGYEVRPFSNQTRESKIYFYPEDPVEWPMNVVRIIDMNRNDKHFLNNTEDVFNCPTELYGTFHKCFVPAAGLSPLITPWRLGMTEGSEVTVYDISYAALRTAEYLHSYYKGEKIHDFYLSCCTVDALSTYHSSFFCNYDEVVMQNLLDNEIDKGFDVWLKTVVPKITYKFCYLNIFDSNTWFNLSEKTPLFLRSFISLSNIFSYNADMSLKDKVSLANDFFNNLKNEDGEWYLDLRNYTNPEREFINLKDLPIQTIPQSVKFLPWNR